MDLTWITILIVFAVGYFCGAATMALMALSSTRTRDEGSRVAYKRDPSLDAHTTGF